MGKLRSDFEADFEVFANLLRWADGVSLFIAVVMILLLIVWWPN